MSCRHVPGRHTLDCELSRELGSLTALYELNQSEKNIMQSCSNCFYQREARMPGQIQSVKVCAFDPPKIYVLPAPNGGVQVAAFQTQVNPDQWCGKWIDVDAPKLVPQLSIDPA